MPGAVPGSRTAEALSVLVGTKGRGFRGGSVSGFREPGQLSQWFTGRSPAFQFGASLNAPSVGETVWVVQVGTAQVRPSLGAPPPDHSWGA